MQSATGGNGCEPGTRLGSRSQALATRWLFQSLCQWGTRVAHPSRCVSNLQAVLPELTRWRSTLLSTTGKNLCWAWKHSPTAASPVKAFGKRPLTREDPAVGASASSAGSARCPQGRAGRVGPWRRSSRSRKPHQPLPRLSTSGAGSDRRPTARAPSLQDLSSSGPQTGFTWNSSRQPQSASHTTGLRSWRQVESASHLTLRSHAC